MLYQRESLLGSVYHREQEDIAAFVDEEELSNHEMETRLLVEAMRRVIMAIPEKDKHRETFFKTLHRDTFTVESKLLDVRERLKSCQHLSFTALFAESPIKEEVIVTFIALLELLKLKEIKVVQNTLFAEIEIIGIDSQSTLSIEEKQSEFIEE